MPVSPSTPAHGVDDAVSSGASTTRSRPSDKTKGIRNQNACDACRDRKVKCQEKNNALLASPLGQTVSIKSLVESEAHSGSESQIENPILRRFPEYCAHQLIE
ncbi:unnamed protein product [Clonostachys byssicola]|uniref:Zn(2)-C6 fungal-type domain-containing protein n=1 Tax=Clonostachys byssicola TaxID=160290 RepID=A0A9N9UW96_9HYPO|nr:unnamed protein product [Clonostachys byssicola]